MLEVCFNESVKGALAVAQRCENSVGGTVGIIADKKLSFFAVRKALKEYRKRQDELQKSAVPLGGKRRGYRGHLPDAVGGGYPLARLPGRLPAEGIYTRVGFL